MKSSKKRLSNEVHKLPKPKRRKGDTFSLNIPTRQQKIGQVFVIGSNEFSQGGVEDVEHFKKFKSIETLEKFKIVDISAGSLHNAALTVDSKIVT